jgi:group II intron reverse transcriptase/maturase
MEQLEGNMADAQTSGSMSTECQRIAQLAKEHPEMSLTSLAHHMDVAWLEEAYRRTSKGGAVGVDGQSGTSYGENLAANIQNLHARLKAGLYKAPPVRRAYIPKPGSEERREIGIPTFEDKVVQRAVCMLLEPIYEQDFLPCSYGFRPHRSAHQALEELRTQLMEMHGGWVIEADIRKCFDTLSHGHIRSILRQRVCDGALLRLVGKWLNAGVLSSEGLRRSEQGTPQGGVISPLLCNVYLHEVLDKWFEVQIKGRLRGKASLIRFADDFVIAFAERQDAERVMAVLQKRFERYGLKLHPEKTRIVPMMRPRFGETTSSARQRGGIGTLDFLGFTHTWGVSLKGNWVIKQWTSRKRQTRTLRAIRAWCKRWRHEPLEKQRLSLCSKLRGHYNYYGITGNMAHLNQVYFQTKLSWKKWLSRRSGHSLLSWEMFDRLQSRYPLPLPVIRLQYNAHSKSKH